MHLDAYLLDHSLIFGSIGSAVKLQLLGGGFSALKLTDNSSCYQIHIRGASREVQILASVHDRGTAETDMNLPCSTVIEEIRCLAELSSSDYRVIDEQQPFVLDKIVYRDKLHFCDEVALVLMGRHK